MTKIYDNMELFLVIALTLLAKWMMSEQPIPDGETAKHRKLRFRRTVGGILAGVVCAWYGHAPLQSSFEVLNNPDLTIPLVILLAVSGEHILRALMTKLPDWIQMFVEHRLKLRKDQ